MVSTFAGNLTVLGSVANLIVLQKSKNRISISFWEYFKVGLPLTLLTISAGLLFL
jgi:Na+/H+ antiporter NhaD/arsenite permease-like protein